MLRAMVVILTGVVSTAYAGQLYRWVDNAGGVHYSDQPPPPSVKQVRTLYGSRNPTAETGQIPSEASATEENNPVTLYANACGPVCDNALNYLKQRGIPFTQKDPSREPEAAQQVKDLTGSLEVPVIVVGKTHLKGFEPSSWGSVLDAAGYPKAPGANQTANRP
jgi:glutaredoxin